MLYNKRIKAVRFTHSTAQELRTCVALYARRSAHEVDQVRVMLSP
jgi:hypothetical protein